MKRIEAIVRAEHLDAILDVTADLGIQATLVSEVRGIGIGDAPTLQYRGHRCISRLSDRLRVEMIANESSEQAILEVLRRAMPGADPADSLILVSTIELAAAAVVR